MSYKTGKGAKLPVPLFCHPQPCKMEQFTPSSAGCSLQCSQASEAEGGVLPEISCPYPQGTKCWVIVICGCDPSEWRRFVDVGMNLRHIQEAEQEARKPMSTFT